MEARHPIALLVVLCGLLCGCGGSAASPPKYVAEGDGICAGDLAQLNRLPQPSSPEQAVSYLPKALTIMQGETDRLATLDPPAANQVELTAALQSARRLATVLRDTLHELRSGVVELGTLAQAQAQSDALRRTLDARFRDAGLARCAE